MSASRRVSWDREGLRKSVDLKFIVSTKYSSLAPIGPIADLFRSFELRGHVGPIVKLEVIFNDDRGHMLADIMVPDRDDLQRWIPVQFAEEFMMPRADYDHSHVTAAIRVMENIRRFLTHCLTHEIDENIHFDGIRTFDPHRGEMQMRVTQEGVTSQSVTIDNVLFDGPSLGNAVTIPLGIRKT